MWNIWKEQTFQILWGNCLVATTSWSEFDRRLHETPFYLQNDLTGLTSLFSTVCRKTPAEDSSHRNWSMGKTSSYTASFRSDGPACLGEPGSLCWCQYPGKLRSLAIQELPQLLARKLLHLPSQRSLTGLEPHHPGCTQRIIGNSFAFGPNLILYSLSHVVAGLGNLSSP